MYPQDFPEANIYLGENQEEYVTLPAHMEHEDGTPQKCVTTCIKLSFRERLVLLFTGRIWQQSLTFGKPYQPQMLSVYCPFDRD